MTGIVTQAIRSLAAIDAELGLPEDGCNSTARTLAAIRALQAKAEIAQALAKTTMAGMSADRLYTPQDVADACVAAEIPDSKCESLLLALGV